MWPREMRDEASGGALKEARVQVHELSARAVSPGSTERPECLAYESNIRRASATAPLQRPYTPGGPCVHGIHDVCVNAHASRTVNTCVTHQDGV